MIPKKELLNVPVTCLPFDEQIMLMLRWAKMRCSKVVCLANVHMLMEAYWHTSFKNILYKADLVTPDGKPLVMMLRGLGVHNQNQVSGMDVFLNLCNLAEGTNISIYFLGSTNEILEKIRHKIEQEYPILKIAGMKAIPYLSIEEIRFKQDAELIEEINQSQAGIVFICLGCPKQEIWMSQYQGLIHGVMIGVGAVFSMYIGINPRAPHWIQRAGLEWLYRLWQEPKRLWGRYGTTIPPFLYLAIKQLLAPNKEKLQQDRQSLPDGNMLLDIDELDNSPNKIGEILIRQGLISGDCLKDLLQEQQSSSLKLGEILIRKNMISLPQLRYYLRNQNIKLGEVLLERKLIRKNKMEQVLLLQKSRKTKKMGEILTDLKVLSNEQVKSAILEQYCRRKGLWLNQKNSEQYSAEEYYELVKNL